jgi:hypothetical protein
MPRIIQSIHLSEYQAHVMLIAFEAPTPELAFAEMGKQDKRIEPNLLGARDTLAKLGLITVDDRSITITPEGEKVMQDEYLVDEMGEISEKGQEILGRHTDEITPPTQKTGPSDSDMGQAQAADMAPTSIGGEMETTPDNMGESSTLKLINDLIKLKG